VIVSPKDEVELPAIVVIQEWWGLNEQILGVARRLAAEGFVAVVPDLYRGAGSDQPDEARKLVMTMHQGEPLEDLRAVVGWLVDRGVPAVGVTGFCMGGGLTWELALTDERVRAAVVFYGGVEFDGRELRIPVQAHYGTRIGSPTRCTTGSGK
jgi:carboxymethylenebutenolidase